MLVCQDITAQSKLNGISQAIIYIFQLNKIRIPQGQYIQQGIMSKK